MDVELVTYNPMTPGYFADPYAHYAELREQNPAHITKFGFLFLTSHRYVLDAYDHPKLSRDTRQWSGFREWRRSPDDGPLERMMANWLVMIDPPRHTPLREVHNQVFTRERMAGQAQIIDSIIGDLVAEGAKNGGLDLVADFAEKIPVYLINHMLDLPREDWDQFVAWSKAISNTSEPQLTTKVLQAGRDALEGMYEYLNPLVDRRKVEPAGDVLSGLTGSTPDGRSMTRQEVLDSITFLYQAGHPTSTQLIALGLSALLRHPEQWALLQADPSLIPAAVEEMQRFDGPVQMNDRVALEDMEVCGVPLEKGQLIRLCLASANRDPERYPNPDVLDIKRQSTGEHLGYGHGLHYCVAAALGRMQARVALEKLLSVAPKLQITETKLRYLPSVSNRGLKSLQVSF